MAEGIAAPELVERLILKFMSDVQASFGQRFGLLRAISVDRHADDLHDRPLKNGMQLSMPPSSNRPARIFVLLFLLVLAPSRLFMTC